jgi:hypothetical protein
VDTGGWRRQVAWFVGLAAIGLLGVGIVLMVRDRGTTLDSEVVPTVSASAGDVQPSEEGPQVLSVIDAEQAAPVAVDEKVTPPPLPSTTPKNREPAAPTRARQHGLAEENPFGQ